VTAEEQSDDTSTSEAQNKKLCRKQFLAVTSVPVRAVIAPSFAFVGFTFDVIGFDEQASTFQGFGRVMLYSASLSGGERGMVVCGIASLNKPSARVRLAYLLPYSTKSNGGERGIRTLGTVSSTRPFQGRTIGHSVISPAYLIEQIDCWFWVN
jgi:hypothetical protein